MKIFMKATNEKDNTSMLIFCLFCSGKEVIAQEVTQGEVHRRLIIEKL